jgi:hypothetical protein
MTDYIIRTTGTDFTLVFVNPTSKIETKCFKVGTKYPSFYSDYSDIVDSLKAYADSASSVQELLELAFNDEFDLVSTVLRRIQLGLECEGIISKGLKLKERIV